MGTRVEVSKRLRLDYRMGSKAQKSAVVRSVLCGDRAEQTYGATVFDVNHDWGQERGSHGSAPA